MASSRKLHLTLVALVVVLGGLSSPAAASHTDRKLFEFRVTTFPDGRKIGTFRYERHLSTPTLDAPAGWLDGDRAGYRCGYGFLEYRGHLVGRVTVTRIDPPGEKSYVKVSDAFMEEGVRNHDGTINTYTVPAGGGEPQPAPGRSCPDLTQSYDPLVGDPGPRPVVRYQHGPHTIEVRNFADPLDVTKVGSGHKFKIVRATADSVEVIAYQDRVPALAIYYNLLVGDAEIPGTMHPVTLHTTA